MTICANSSLVMLAVLTCYSAISHLKMPTEEHVAIEFYHIQNALKSN